MIEIYYKKIIVYGRKYRKILGFKMIGKSKLPEQYLKGYPSCFLVDGNIDMSTKNGGHRIFVGDMYCEDAYQNIKLMLKECGARLHEINNVNDWKGKGVDEI